MSSVGAAFQPASSAAQSAVLPPVVDREAEKAKATRNKIKAWLQEKGWDLSSFLGSGTSASVFKAVHKDRPFELGAMKIAYPGHLKSLRNEASNFKYYFQNIQVPHANSLIASISEVIDEDIEVEALVTKMVTNPNLYFDCLSPEAKHVLEIDDIYSIAYQSLEFLRELAISGLIYGDFKPENMIYTPDGRLTFIDFGLLCNVENPMSIIQSRYYRAPEVILNRHPWNHADMWSLGCTLFELFTKKTLCCGSNKENTDQEHLSILAARFGEDVVNDFIVHGKVTKREGILPWKEEMRIEGEKQRFSSDQIEKMIAFIEPMFGFKKRITPSKALEYPLFKEKWVTVHVDIKNAPALSSSEANDHLNDHYITLKNSEGKIWSHYIDPHVHCLHLPKGSKSEYQFCYSRTAEPGLIEEQVELTNGSSLKIEWVRGDPILEVIQPEVEKDPPLIIHMNKRRRMALG